MALLRRGLAAVGSFRFQTLLLFLSSFVAGVFLLSSLCMAQQAPQAESSDPSTNVPESHPVTIPPGTHFALVLTHPVDSKSMHRGDEIYAQTTAPVTVGDQVVIPPGTFVQGRIEKVKRNGNRGVFLIQSFSVVFQNGYVANVTGPMTIESGEGTAWRNPGTGAKAGAILAPFIGSGVGMAIGAAAHTTETIPWGNSTLTSNTPKGIAVGSMVGLGAGSAVTIVLLTHSRDFYVEVGSPMQMTLGQPLTLAASQVDDAIRAAAEYPLPPPMSDPADHGTCYRPGTPGTPSTVIPGTPAIGDLPGTPDVVLPGTPPTPGTSYPCP